MGHFKIPESVAIFLGAIIGVLTLRGLYTRFFAGRPTTLVSVRTVPLITADSSWGQGDVLSHMEQAASLWHSLANIQVTWANPKIISGCYQAGCPLMGDIGSVRSSMGDPKWFKSVEDVAFTETQNPHNVKNTHVTIFTGLSGGLWEYGYSLSKKDSNYQRQGVSVIFWDAAQLTTGFIVAHEWGHTFGLHYSHATSNLMLSGAGLIPFLGLYDYFIQETLEDWQRNDANQGAKQY